MVEKVKRLPFLLDLLHLLRAKLAARGRTGVPARGRRARAGLLDRDDEGLAAVGAPVDPPAGPGDGLVGELFAHRDQPREAIRGGVELLGGVEAGGPLAVQLRAADGREQ